MPSLTSTTEVNLLVYHYLKESGEHQDAITSRIGWSWRSCSPLPISFPLPSLFPSQSIRSLPHDRLSILSTFRPFAISCRINAGFHHACFALRNEGRLDDEPLSREAVIEPGRLLRFLQKGLRYMAVEAHVNPVSDVAVTDPASVHGSRVVSQRFRNCPC